MVTAVEHRRSILASLCKKCGSMNYYPGTEAQARLGLRANFRCGHCGTPGDVEPMVSVMVDDKRVAIEKIDPKTGEVLFTRQLGPIAVEGQSCL